MTLAATFVVADFVVANFFFGKVSGLFFKVFGFAFALEANFFFVCTVSYF
jgi:hypothetical protein